jgi:hypothetical protein
LISRILLTVGTLAFAGAVYALMLKGWRGRSRRQADLPAPPAATARSGSTHLVTLRVAGLFVGTTGADDWLDRIVVHRLSDRGRGELDVGQDGVHLTRERLPELYVPFSSIEAVTVEHALAGKVVSTGLLVLTWRLGARRLASAFRADDPAAHARLRDAITAMLPVEAA